MRFHCPSILAMLGDFRALCLQSAPIFLAAMVCLSPATGKAADGAEFRVTDEVAVTAPPRFGLNFDAPNPSHWAGWIPHNNWVRTSGFEPVHFRHMSVATGGSETTLVDQGPGRASYYDTFQKGWFDGGTVRIYRLADGVMRAVRTATVKESDIGKGTTETLTFTEPGPPVQEGDLYFLDIEHVKIPPTRQGSHAKFATAEIGRKGEGVRWALDDGTAPPGGGRSSLRLDIEGAEHLGIQSHFLGTTGNPEYFYWTKAPSGNPIYKLSFWAKQEGLDGGRVTAKVLDFEHTFQVTGEWQHFKADVELKDLEKLGQIAIHGHGPGTLWIDNWTLIQPGQKVDALDPVYVNEIADFRPGHIRIWNGLNQGKSGATSLDNWLAPLHERRSQFGFEAGLGGSLQGSLPQYLELCETVGASPWLIVSMTYSEKEMGDLIEFLAGGMETPYGKKRAELGRAEPWTKAFPEILIEAGNEQWNQIFRPVAFPGKPELYAAHANFLFAAAKANPAFDPAKFRFLVNGWAKSRSWNTKVSKAAPLANAIGIAGYTGGGFDTQDIESATGNEDTYSLRMFYPLRVTLADKLALLEDALASGLKPAVYEAGPGYDLASPGKMFDERDELVGKSVVSGIATLDDFLFGQEHGFVAQCYFLFKVGPKWSTHSPWPGFHRHSTYQALRLRNRYCDGDLMKTETLTVPRIDLPEAVSRSKSWNGKEIEQRFPAQPGVDLVKAYTFRDGTRTSVLLYSRELSRTIPITIHYPRTQKPGGRLLRLEAAAPHSNNIHEEQVRTVQSDHPVGGLAATVQLSPFSACVLMTEE